MKTIIICFVLCLSMATMACAADFNLTGVWTYPHVPNSVQIISQSGNDVYSAVYHQLDGNPAGIVGHTIGKVQGNKMTWKSTVTRRPNSTWGGANGVTMQYFTISPDGNTLNGTWKNDQGEGTFILKKVQ
jgi:hypothetical protein